jgi:hypothetical protein
MWKMIIGHNNNKSETRTPICATSLIVGEVLNIIVKQNKKKE